ncbi:MAG: STAS domain-containing protein [Actinomycetota bacterium]|nr:STAS domain-containing protein [Actinomycetota bacterium]
MIPHLAARSAVVVRLVTEIDLTNREQMYDRLYAALALGAPVVIADFSATRFCDCASLRRLIKVQERAAAYGSQLRLVIPPGSPVGRLADLIDLADRLLIYPSAREATAWLPKPGEVFTPIASLPGAG